MPTFVLTVLMFLAICTCRDISKPRYYFTSTVKKAILPQVLKMKQFVLVALFSILRK